MRRSSSGIGAPAEAISSRFGLTQPAGRASSTCLSWIGSKVKRPIRCRRISAGISVHLDSIGDDDRPAETERYGGRAIGHAETQRQRQQGADVLRHIAVQPGRLRQASRSLPTQHVEALRNAGRTRGPDDAQDVVRMLRRRRHRPVSGPGKDRLQPGGRDRPRLPAARRVMRLGQDQIDRAQQRLAFRPSLSWNEAVVMPRCSKARISRRCV